MRQPVFGIKLVGACADQDLLVHIKAEIEASPFQGEGYRKIWARLRYKGVRTAAPRVRRVMKENGLLAPHRPGVRPEQPHEGTIVTEPVDEVLGRMLTSRRKGLTLNFLHRQPHAAQAPIARLQAASTHSLNKRDRR